eukprot:GGOE01041271.1.p1 GENE.GGOE01041271.1~~GGOE01041271.1.p1  ORF type:complete len:439 (+),score=156.39 GGOE01041271.1:78-1394(+)
MRCTKCRAKRGRPNWWPNLVAGVCPSGGAHNWATDDLQDTFETGLNAFLPLCLTPAGRPHLDDGEIELCVQEAVALYNGDHQTDYQDGSLYLTNRRLLYVEKGGRRAIALPLEALASAEKRAGYCPGWSSPKVVLNVTGLPPGRHVMCSFRNGSNDPFFDRLQDVLNRKPWQQPVAPVRKVFSTASAGVAGIMRGAEEQERRTRTTVQEAFQSLGTLMQSAKELTDIARRMQAQNARLQRTEEEEDEFHQYLLGLGLASPVSRNTIGAKGDFHAELSRQLCDFLQEPLRQNSGTLSLIDIFCLYNRARGSDLISPDDLLKACNLFGPLGLPLLLRHFPSGVIVVQSVDLQEGHVQAAVLAFLATHPCITALQLAELLGVPLVLAAEYLAGMEMGGALCRDEALEGVAFYRNFFADAALADAIAELLRHQPGSSPAVSS